MKRSKRMLIVMLTSFAILFFLTFLTFAGYGQVTQNHIDSVQKVKVASYN